MLPVEPEPQVTSNVPPVPVPVTWLPTIDNGAVAADRLELPETLIVCEPAPLTVYVAVAPAHGSVEAIPAPVISKSAAAGDAVTVTAMVVVAWQPFTVFSTHVIDCAPVEVHWTVTCVTPVSKLPPTPVVPAAVCVLGRTMLVVTFAATILPPVTNQR
jgi:hypothetical protein